MGGESASKCLPGFPLELGNRGGLAGGQDYFLRSRMEQRQKVAPKIVVGRHCSLGGVN